MQRERWGGRGTPPNIPPSRYGGAGTLHLPLPRAHPPFSHLQLVLPLPRLYSPPFPLPFPSVLSVPVFYHPLFLRFLLCLPQPIASAPPRQPTHPQLLLAASLPLVLPDLRYLCHCAIFYPSLTPPSAQLLSTPPTFRPCRWALLGLQTPTLLRLLRPQPPALPASAPPWPSARPPPPALPPAAGGLGRHSKHWSGCTGQLGCGW